MHAIMDSYDKLYNCNICWKTFANSSAFRMHFASHTGERSYTCEYCSNVFRQSGTLRDHIRIHTGEKPYKCNVCYRAFIKRCDFKTHMRIHTGEKPYKCQLCNEAFIRKAQLERHIETHFGDQLNSTELCKNVVPRISEGCIANPYQKRVYTLSNNESCFNVTLHVRKPYICSFCDKRLASAGSLKTHIIIHTDQKPYKCELCNKAFRQSNQLKVHVRTHTGEKPYNCSICDKAFTEKSSLNWHNMRNHTVEELCKYGLHHNTVGKRCNLINITKHTGEKPYKCDFCKASFTQKGLLETHTGTHTGQKLYSAALHRNVVPPLIGMHHESTSLQRYYGIYNGVDSCLDGKELLMTENPQDLSSLPNMNPSSNENNLSAVKSTISSVMKPFVLRSYGCGICDEMFVIEKEFMEHSSNHYDIPLKDTFIDLFEVPSTV